MIPDLPSKESAHPTAFGCPSSATATQKHGNTPSQYSGKVDQSGRFDLLFTVFCGYSNSRWRSAKGRQTAKLCFHPQQRRGLVVLVMSVEELVYVFSQTRANDFIISVFQEMRHEFFQPHPRPIKALCASQFGFAFDFAFL